MDSNLRSKPNSTKEVKQSSITIDPKSIEEGCDVKDYLKSFALGFFAGAVAGGVGVGILDGIIGIGSSAIKVSSATVEQWIAVGASSAAVGGVACSLAADAEKKFLDVGTVAWAATGWTSEVAATNAEVGLVSGARRFGLSFAKSLVKVITNNSSTALLCGIAGYAEERADDERENRPHSEHLKECAIKLTANAVGDCAVKMLSTTGKHVFNEIQILSNDTTSTKTEKQIQKDRFDYHKKTKLTHTESNVKVTYPNEKHNMHTENTYGMSKPHIML
ncbi:unnamed protein product [Mytilus edulis]|uniref:Uncharacterized protein n=1 Tax=Mytilus edulis TaxID=6550 RepID=A0A8S3RBU6_MYTED|nr:unnamed protein product [Mytilus edulis]